MKKIVFFALVCAMLLCACSCSRSIPDGIDGGESRYSETVLVEYPAGYVDCGLYAREDGTVDYLSVEYSGVGSRLVTQKFLGTQLVFERSIELPAEGESDYNWGAIFANSALADDGTLYINATRYENLYTINCILRLPPDATDFSGCEELVIPRPYDDLHERHRSISAFTLPDDDTLSFTVESNPYAPIYGDEAAASDMRFEPMTLDLKTMELRASLLGGEAMQAAHNHGNGIVWRDILFWMADDMGRTTVFSKHYADCSKTEYPKTRMIATGRPGYSMGSSGYAELPLLCGADDEAIYFIDPEGIFRIEHGADERELLVSAEGSAFELKGADSLFLEWCVKRAVKAEGGDIYLVLHNEADHFSGAVCKLVCYSPPAPESEGA